MATTVNIQSWKRCRLILNDRVFRDWFDDPIPVVIPEITFFDIARPMSGGMYVMATEVTGGPVELKLQSHSEDAQFLSRIFAEQTQGNYREWNGTFGDPSVGWKTNLIGGVLQSCLAGAMPNQPFVARFEFLKTIPDMDGATFAPTPIIAQ